MNTRRRTLLALAVALTATLSWPTLAQNYPSKPIKLVVPFPPGGPTDMVGRLLAEHLAQGLGQAVVVENRAGAGGTIGAAYVAKAPPDGYTLLYGSTSTLAISPSVYKSLSYDPATAFEPVALVSRGKQVLVVSTNLPVRTLKELVEYARQHPNQVNYSSPGNGTPGHLAAELLKTLTGMQALHVPYKGGAPSLNAVLAGDVQFTVDVVPTSLPFIKADRLRALAVLSTTQSKQLPDVPTVKESGYPEISADFWSGLVAPAGTPADVVERLNAEVRKITASPEFAEKLLITGAVPQATTRAEFAAFIQAEMKKWAEVARAANVKQD